LTATDNPGGFGVDTTYYTTDGSTPTTSSTVYTGPFTLKQTSTVQFFSTDLAGNAEAVNSQAIPFSTVVSLTFDDGDLSQYAVGWLHGLQPHNLRGTFYIPSGFIEVDPNAMTWPDVVGLYNTGNDIGGHTVDHVNLTTLTTAQATPEVCNDRQALIQHGTDPVNFAYPFGAYNAGAEAVVKSCGYTTGRAAGGIDVGIAFAAQAVLPDMKALGGGWSENSTRMSRSN